MASNLRFNSTFAYVNPKDKKATFEKLETALSSALSSFGKIPLILVGAIADNVKVETKIDHKLFSHMILDPSQQQLATVNGDTVTIRYAQDVARTGTVPFRQVTTCLRL